MARAALTGSTRGKGSAGGYNLVLGLEPYPEGVCKVHFLRNVLSRIPKGSAEMVLALIGTIWTQPDPAAVRAQLDEVAAKLEPRFPAVAAMPQEAREGVTAFAAFPFSHWKKIWSTNLL